MTHNKIMEAQAIADYLRAVGHPGRAEYVEQLMNECLKLRQGLWDVGRICGADTDGDETPAALISSIVLFAKHAATDLRRDYDEAISEAV